MLTSGGNGELLLKAGFGLLPVTLFLFVLVTNQFRGVPLGHILYSGDSLAGDTWDSRDWNKHWTLREKLVGLASEACLLL